MGRKKQNTTENNSGSAMVMVIIAIALVSILVAVIMVMSALNLQMKYTERQAKRNFYTAETAMEQIRAGLEQDVSEAAESAYNSIQPTYAQYSQAQREINFRANYMNKLRDGLKDGTDNKYNLTKLQGYLDDTQFTDVNTNLVSVSGCVMEGLSSGLLLRGVRIEYTDASGYISVVETDFRLLIPDLKFTQSSVMPQLFDYSLVAEKGIKGSQTGKVVFENNIYAGGEGIFLEKASDWQFKNMDRLVCKGTTEVKNTARLSVDLETNTKTDAKVNFWTGDILVDNAAASLSGRTYVADDLTLKGKNSQVKLKNEYYGYGNGTELETDGSFTDNKNKSSAMLMNGLNSTLDMQKLDRLLLAGRAGIATGGTEITAPDKDDPDLTGMPIEKNENIPLGEAIEIKSNQMAYLVPAECIGINEGEALIGKNPMSAEDYRRLLIYNEDKIAYPDFKEVSYDTTVTKLGKTLNDYSAGDSLKFQKIFQQIGTEIIVYYYLVLDEQIAPSYFADYYKAEQKKMDSYMKQHTNKILINDKMSRMVFGGNIVIYDGENISLQQNDKVLTPEEVNGLKEEQNSYMETFAALNCKLISNYDNLSNEEKTKGVFENLVNKQAVNTTIKQNFELEVDDGKGNKHKIYAVIAPGDYTYGNKATDSSTCLIVAGGSVTVDKDFEGLIIAGGEVVVSSAVTIKGNKADLIKMLQCPVDVTQSDSKTIIQAYFNGGDGYVLEGTSIEKPETDEKMQETYLDITDYVQYENWKKK